MDKTKMAQEITDAIRIMASSGDWYGILDGEECVIRVRGSQIIASPNSDAEEEVRFHIVPV